MTIKIILTIAQIVYNENVFKHTFLGCFKYNVMCFIFNHLALYQVKLLIYKNYQNERI